MNRRGASSKGTDPAIRHGQYLPDLYSLSIVGATLRGRPRKCRSKPLSPEQREGRGFDVPDLTDLPSPGDLFIFGSADVLMLVVFER